MANEIERGKRMLRAYLNSMAGDMSNRTRLHLFKLFEENYIAHMEGDPDYFKEISDFLNRRKPAKEKEEFCYAMVKKLLKYQDVRKAYRERYPGDFE